jgi:uncharacterized phage protein gp47/JayE
MAFTRPTLAELVERIQQDFVSRLALVNPILRRSLVYVLSRVIAGAVHMLYGALEFLARQMFPDLSERAFLLRQGRLFGLTLNAATFATGNVTITGTNGAIIPAGTVLLHADGAAYATAAEVTIAGGTATAAVTAAAAGQDGNRAEGVTLSFESPIATVNATATVAAVGLASGTDEEDIEDFRTRVLERMRSPPHGGAASDYIAWAREVAGVTRAWCFPLEGGAGTVTVRFVRDDDASLIPDAGEVAAVQAHIDAVRPVTATVTVAAPTAVALNFTIHVVPDNSATRAAVEAELRDLLLRAAKPGGTILLSQIRGAVDDAAGVTDWSVTAPAADVTHTTAQMATFGAITWN